jgi:hypothetical protein
MRPSCGFENESTNRHKATELERFKVEAEVPDDRVIYTLLVVAGGTESTRMIT